MTLVRYYPKNRSEALEGSTWLPQADIIEHDNRYEIVVDLPGFNKEDFNLKVNENVLTLSGERNTITPESDKFYRFYERPSGKFVRSFRLPDNIDIEQIHASYENGMLRLELVKKAEAQPKIIAVS